MKQTHRILLGVLAVSIVLLTIFLYSYKENFDSRCQGLNDANTCNNTHTAKDATKTCIWNDGTTDGSKKQRCES